MLSMKIEKIQIVYLINVFGQGGKVQDVPNLLLLRLPVTAIVE